MAAQQQQQQQFQQQQAALQQQQQQQFQAQQSAMQQQFQVQQQAAAAAAAAQQQQQQLQAAQQQQQQHMLKLQMQQQQQQNQQQVTNSEAVAGWAACSQPLVKWSHSRAPAYRALLRVGPPHYGINVLLLVGKASSWAGRVRWQQCALSERRLIFPSKKEATNFVPFLFEIKSQDDVCLLRRRSGYRRGWEWTPDSPPSPEFPLEIVTVLSQLCELLICHLKKYCGTEI